MEGFHYVSLHLADETWQTMRTLCLQEDINMAQLVDRLLITYTKHHTVQLLRVKHDDL